MSEIKCGPGRPTQPLAALLITNEEWPTMHASDPPERGPARWGQLVEILAGMPDVVGRLAFEHVPDENNRCRGCTLPGTGRPNEPWPCSLRKLADEALRLQFGATPPNRPDAGPRET